ncbi:hypothetical protein [Streptomyces sp. NPDC049879]|uniref:hypothetical protein n=1 Tax=Streptomyces sp. NPDC049879 TaxID=3365598 RepID=UPI0037BB95F6
MSDDNTTDGVPLDGDRGLFAHLADDVAAILEGRPLPRRDPAPTDAGVRLGAALKFHGDIHDFQVTWDGPLRQLATLTVPWPVAAWLQALGAEADPVLDRDAGRVAFLLTEDQCHALAARIETFEADQFPAT